MKVIVAGFPKTGTKSMNWALSALGYKVYDYPENVYLLQKEYKKIFHEGWCTEDFRKMYEDVDAVVDTPAFFFWEELAKAFPDAKVSEQLFIILGETCKDARQAQPGEPIPESHFLGIPYVSPKVQTT